MNPLRIDDMPGEDTLYLVRSVLSFMGEAFEALEQSQDVMPDHAMMGASQIMYICRDALRSKDGEEVGGGGADGG